MVHEGYWPYGPLVLVDCINMRSIFKSWIQGWNDFKTLFSNNFRNVTLEKAEFTDPCGNRRNFDQFFVQQRLIRCVQIPTMLDIREALKKSVLPKRKQDQIELSKNRKHILKKRNEQRLQDQMNAVKKSWFYNAYQLKDGT